MNSSRATTSFDMRYIIVEILRVVKFCHSFSHLPIQQKADRGIEVDFFYSSILK